VNASPELFLSVLKDLPDKRRIERLFQNFSFWNKLRLVQEPGWFSAEQRSACKSCKMLCVLFFSAEFVEPLVRRKLKFLDNSDAAGL
jgi:hypothetical protein